MRKITCMAAMVAALLFAIPANAQFCWGIKGGVNVGSNGLAILTEKGQAFNKESYTGFFIGPKAEVTIPVVGLGIEAAAMYAQQGMALTAKDTYKQSSIQVPLNLKYSIGLGNVANVFVAVGPEFGYNVGRTQMQLDNIVLNNENEVGDAVFEFNKTMLSFNMGFGATVLNHVQVGLNYHFPWGTVGEFKMPKANAIKEDANTAERIEGGDVTAEDISWLNKKSAQAQKFSDNFKAGMWQISVAYLF